MVITIYDKDGTKKADIAVDDSSTQTKEVQGDNVLALTFTYWEHLQLNVNDWCEFEGERYWLMERYAPTEKSLGEWEYDLKMYGIESLIKRFLVLETTDGNSEPVFTLTATPKEHVAMIVKCINAGMGNTTDWKVGTVEGTDYIVIDYEGKYCDDALKEIAEAVGGQAEWWIEGQTVNICRCITGNTIELGYGAGLLDLECDVNSSAKFYTRLFPIGSSRNIDPEKYGYSRLMLPGGQQYVEIGVDQYGIYDQYEKDAFADIYPKRVGRVTSVRSTEVKDDDGNPYTIYYFKDSTLDFDPNDYELASQVKRVSFQTGNLAGLGSDDDHYFEVNYSTRNGEFEIITIWPYDDDTQLPGGSLIPKVGDEYILWNIRMPDEYYPAAEQEFLEAVNTYNDEHWQDINIYKGTTDHVWMEENDVELYLGRRVRLLSEKYFLGIGYRDSRITKFTRYVNHPTMVDLEISDALQTGALDKINDSIGEVKSYAKEAIADISLPAVIHTWDNTTPTDNNLFSSKRSQQEFVCKKKDDAVKGKLTMEKGFKVGVEGDNGMDADGNTTMLSAVLTQFLQTPNFVDGLTGEGLKLWMEDGLSHLTIDTLTVRQTWRVLELLIDKVRSVGGQIVASAANGKIREVTKDGVNYYITFENAGGFAVNDLIRCAKFDTSHQEYQAYWVEIKGVDASGTVTIPIYTFDKYDTEPTVGDEVVLMGNTKDKTRQNLVLISATDDGQPRVDVLNGVKSTSLSGCLRARLGNLDGIVDSSFGDDQPSGDGLYADNAYLKGKFILASGEDIQTKFEIQEGKVQSSITALRNELAEDKGILNNPTFASGFTGWNTNNDAVFFLVGNKWIWTNNKVLSQKGDGAYVTTDMERTVVRIQNRYIEQKNANLRDKPTYHTNSDGEKEALPVYLSFYYRCAKAGKMIITFKNVDKTGFAAYNSMEVSESLTETDGYVQYTCSGLWNGTGDFRLAFDGDIYIYMFVLSTDEIDSLTYKYRTLFEQSDRLAKLSAAIYDKDDNLLRETGLLVQPEGSGIYMQGADGKLALIGVGVEGSDGKTVIKLTADNLQLEGLVTANGNFRILEDGSIQANNGSFNGVVNANLVYSKVLHNASNGYHIDPTDEPYSMYFWDTLEHTDNEGETNRNYAILPIADEYDGLELSFMYLQLASADSKSLYLTSINKEYDDIYFPQSTDAGSPGSYAKWVYLYPNEVIVFKALGGRWYLIQGRARNIG
jgi:hypothetical protein